MAGGSYALSGTDLLYRPPTHSLVRTSYGPVRSLVLAYCVPTHLLVLPYLWSYALVLISAMLLQRCYAVSVTDLGYAATRWVDGDGAGRMWKWEGDVCHCILEYEPTMGVLELKDRSGYAPTVLPHVRY
eukprot:777213-Rhodomonas_salina.11